ncbi:MAG: hypothetical protein A2Y10_02870 [Planctomycetes bacterium GWF2_41_51]|nr:MAG: hypothetical protein A2Y10_02870 [Planctomycetes bacterium GWF2_41_51]HBG27493.1 hypothetical protein [Phycisphaerales bacterium]
MSNNVEFFQPQCAKLAVGPAIASVYVDGVFCDFLNVESITIAADPDFNKAQLNCSINSDIECGRKIVIKTVYDSGIGITRPEEITVFAGYIEQIEIAETTKITAKDYSSKLKRKTVYGRNIYSSGQTIFIASAETAFNPSGIANLSKESHFFTADENDAKLFKCADAIYYLLQTYIPAGELVIPTLAELESLTENCGIIDVDVTGLNLIDAISRCCKQAGLRFKFVPTYGETSATETIVFFRPEICRQVELNCQWQGEKIDISKTNICEVSQKKNYAAVNRYIVQGDYKIFEATFELVKGWDPSLEANDYDRYSPITNENFNEVRDVYRKWVLNEAGDYSASPYNQGEAFNFSNIFENANYIRKRRRFLPALACGQDGSSIGYNLEMSYTDGSYWWPYMNSFKVLLDQCGIWLSTEQLDSDMWFAILKGVLKVRITASVAADERINFATTDGAVNSIIDVVDRVVTLPRRFKYQKVSPYSIFKNTTANEIDNTNALVEFARGLCGSSRNVNEQLEIKTMILSPFFAPGDRITASPDSRDILSVLYDTRNICYVEKVHNDYANQQTSITAVKKRKAI